MKKFTLGFVIGALLFSTVTVFAAGELIVNPNPFPIFVDGVRTEMEGYNINGSTYLKLREFEKLGVGIDFVDRQILITTKKATEDSADIEITKEGNNVSESVPLNKYGLPDFTSYSGKKPEIEDDGKNQYITYNGVRFIRLGWDRNHPPMWGSPYFMNDLKTDSEGNRIISLSKAIDTEEGSKGIVLIKEIPYLFYDHRHYYIPYDYYINTLLPLLTEGAE